MSNLSVTVRIWGCRVMRPLIFSLILLVEFGPTSILKGHQQGSVGSTAQFPQNTDSSSLRQPCFVSQNRQASQHREAVAIATIPYNFRSWLTEDAVYIISPEERCAFLHLKSDRERQQFIDQFWLRRVSDPQALENDFKQEHYRRIVFANENFGTNLPGWRTDRGRVYITFGPPGKMESRAQGVQDKDREGGKRHEKWHYGYIEGLGENIDLAFVDPTRSGDYRLTTPIQIKKEPPYNLPGLSTQDRDVASQTVQQIVAYIRPMPSPKVRFKDLEAMVVARILRDQVCFSHSIEFTRATHASTIVRITVEIPTGQLIPATRDGAQAGEAEIFGRISKPSGWVVETFERTTSIAELDQPTPNRETIVALQPVPYRLSLGVKDVASGNVGLLFTSFHVPRYEDLRPAQ
jgi:GWxTD domain-containing protein